MPEMRRKYDSAFRAGAVWIVRETDKTVAQVARDLGIVTQTRETGSRLIVSRVAHEACERFQNPPTRLPTQRCLTRY